MKNLFSLPPIVAVVLLLAPVNVQAQAPVRIVEPLPVPVQTTIPAEAYQRSVNTASNADVAGNVRRFRTSRCVYTAAVLHHQPTHRFLRKEQHSSADAHREYGVFGQRFSLGHPVGHGTLTPVGRHRGREEVP